MKNYNSKLDFYADDFDREDYESFRRMGYYASNYFEQKDYCLESINFQDDGINFTLRVLDLSSNDEYVMNRFVA